jgi:hypothetical protein
MEFRTLLFGVIALGLASGFLAPLVMPIMVTLSPDQAVVSSGGSTKCRSARTIFDSSKAPPSCFEVMANDLADGSYQERYREEHAEDSVDAEEAERMIERLRERVPRDDDSEE